MSAASLAAWRRWQGAAGPWRAYSVCPALALSALPSSRPASLSISERKRGEFLSLLEAEGTFVLMDLDPARGVALAAEASRQRLAHVVLVLPRWPHDDAVLPCDALVATLQSASNRLAPDVRSHNVVFVLDGDRQNPISPRPKHDSRVDNRYDLAPADLPNLAALRAAGIRRVLKLTRSA